MTASNEGKSPTLANLLFGDGTPKKALLTAVIVGSVLTVINHGDTLMRGETPPIWKVLLTFCVPYCVTTWGAYTGKRAQLRRLQSTRHEKKQEQE